MAEHLPVCHTQLLETTLLTTWALRNRTSSKRTNIKKSAFPLLFISFQINILFYFSWEFAFEGLAGSSAISYTSQRQQRRVSSTVRGVYPKSRSSPSLAQEHPRQAGVSWEENKTEWVQHPSLNLPSMGLQPVLGMDSGKVSRVDTMERTSTWGRSLYLQGSGSLWEWIVRKLLSILDATKFTNLFFVLSNFFFK